MGAIDFRHSAVISAANPPEFAGSDNPGSVAELSPQYDEMDFRVAATSSALLVVPNNYYPGWSVTVNGKIAPIYRTNWFGMGVPVTAGNSLVRLHFATPGAKAGLWLSAISILFWLAAFLAVRYNQTSAFTESVHQHYVTSR